MASVGCGDDTSNNATGPGKPTLDASMTTTTDGSSSSTSPDGGTTLYTRLGGHAGIRAAINAIVGKELVDTQIASFFFNQVSVPVPAGHPTVDQLEECFTDLLAHAAGGTEVYPTVVTDDAGSFTCRDMAAIHQPLSISGGTFDQFVMIAATELMSLNVATSDIATIGAVLNSTKGDIVTPSLFDAGEMPSPNAASTDAGGTGPTDAGGTPQDATMPTDAGTTLYTRLGGHAGIRSALDAIVAKELLDTQIASFFFNQVSVPVPAGHPTVDQLTECFTDLLASAAGGTEVYPTVVTDDAGTFTCRDMATIHQPLSISGGTFDQFVMIAATELMSLNVATSDIATIGAVLNSTKTAIVKASLADAGEMPSPHAAADAGAE